MGKFENFKTELNRTYKRTALSLVLAAACCSSQAFAFWDNPYIPDIDGNIEEFFKKLQGSEPISSPFELTTKELTEIWNKGGLSDLNYEFIQSENGAAIKLLDHSGLGDHVFERALNLRVVSSATGSRDSALAINLGIGNKAQFNDSVNIEIASVSFRDNHNVINLFQGAELTFNDALTVRANLGENSSLLKLENDSVVKLNGETRLDSEGVASAIVVNKGAKLEVNGRLTVKGHNTIQGAGSINVSGDDTEVFIDGGIDSNFTGKYTQKSGNLVITGAVNFSETGSAQWDFSDVSISTFSGNLYNIAASDFVADKDLLSAVIKPNQVSKPFKEIELRDDRVSLDYLNAASNLYVGANVSYTGELVINDNVISEITLDNHYGLLENPSISLASVKLNLEDKTQLDGQVIRVGAVTGRGETLALNKTDLALYGKAHENVAGDYEKLVIGGGSVLTLHGEISERKQAEARRVRLNSKIDVEEGGQLKFSGQTTVLEKGEVRNLAGEVTFKENSTTHFYSNYYQQNGTTTISKGSEVVSDRDIVIFGGAFNVEGSVSAQAVSISGAQSFINGNLSTQNLVINGSESEKSSQLVTFASGANVLANTLSLSGSVLQIQGGSRESASSLVANQISMNDAKINIGTNGLVVIGDGGSGDGLGFDREGALQAVSSMSDRPVAVLAINETLAITPGMNISVGDTHHRQLASGVHFGSAGALLIRPALNSPVFTSDGSGSEISFAQGSSILIEDPFETVQLTDTTIKNINGIDLVEVHSANKNVTVNLQYVDGFGWSTSSVMIKEENFVFPQLQGWLYQNAKPTLDADNVALRFFARADNEAYMSSVSSNGLIAETALSHSLVGTRVNTFNAAGATVKAKYKIANDLLNREESKAPMFFGDVSSGYFYSKDREGFLRSSGYRATYENFYVGTAFKNESGYAMVATVEFSNIDSKSRHSVLEAKAKQYVLDISTAIGKKFDRTEVKGNVGVGYAHDKVSSNLPVSMQMGSMKSTARGWYVTTGVELSYLVGYGAKVAISPQVWHFAGTDEKTKIAGQDAFKLRNESQTIVDLPLKVYGSQEIGNSPMGKVSGNWELGGSIRVGELEKKGKLRAVGFAAEESISQKEFNRWSAFGSAGILIRKKNINAGLNVSLDTGDGRLNSKVSLDAAWIF